MLSMRQSTSVLVGLAFLMIATRFPGLASNFHLQDASWALFFVAGFYLGARRRWAFPALIAIAVGIDLVAIQYYDISNYCVTVAYWFLVPAYGALWFGGEWLRGRASFDGPGFVKLAASAAISASTCFLISNGSFYWLGGRVMTPSWEGWIANFATWYWPFVRNALVHIAVAAFVHVLIAKLLLLRAETRRTPA